MGAIYLFFKGPVIAKATTRQAGRTGSPLTVGGYLRHALGAGPWRAAPQLGAGPRVWCEIWGVFDGIDRINLLLEKQLKEF